MKAIAKRVVILAAAMLSSANAFADGQVVNSWLGGQFSGQQLTSIGSLSATSAVNAGFASGFDWGYAVLGVAEIAVGFEIQTFRSQTLYIGGFGFDSVFASLRIPFKLSPITFYPVARIGYCFFQSDINYTGLYGTLTGGIYYGVGAGLRTPTFEYVLFGITQHDYIYAECTYESNSGSDYNSYFAFTADITYTTVNLCIGFGNDEPATPVTQ
jgi:hypothetical protein